MTLSGRPHWLSKRGHWALTYFGHFHWLWEDQPTLTQDPLFYDLASPLTSLWPLQRLEDTEVTLLEVLDTGLFSKQYVNTSLYSILCGIFHKCGHTRVSQISIDQFTKFFEGWMAVSQQSIESWTPNEVVREIVENIYTTYFFIYSENVKWTWPWLWSWP